MFRLESVYRDGDILKFVAKDKIFWGISVGNAMVVYVEKSSSRVKLDSIVNVGRGCHISIVKNEMSLIRRCFMKKNRPDEIVEKALQNINTETNLESQHFVDFCCQRYRSKLFKVLLFYACYAWTISCTSLPEFLASWLDSYLAIALFIPIVIFGLFLLLVLDLYLNRCQPSSGDRNTDVKKSGNGKMENGG